MKPDSGESDRAFNVKRLIMTLFKRFFLMGFTVLCAYAAVAQEGDISDDSYYETDETMFGSDDESAVAKKEEGEEDNRKSNVQNAILEGVQLSSEDNVDVEDEIIVTCYFIFKEQPTSYFYESKLREKKIVFEFHDTKLGASPIPSAQEPPIQGYRIEETKVNINADVKGLTPEWHDVLRVMFFLDDVPEITVKDEYSIISFSFKWTKDPKKRKNYTVKPPPTRKILIFGLSGLGLAGGAAAAVLYLKPEEPETPPQPLSDDDLPQHPDPYIPQ